MNGRVERVFTVAVVVVLLAGSFWLGQLVVHNHRSHASPPASAVALVPDALEATDLAGKAAPLATGDVERATLLLVLSTECRFCERNMPEWRSLVGSVRELGSGGPDIVALSISPAADTTEFLSAHGVNVPVLLIDDDVLAGLGIPGTPATVGVRPGAETLETWLGMLDRDDTAEVLAWASAAEPVAAAAELP